MKWTPMDLIWMVLCLNTAITREHPVFGAMYFSSDNVIEMRSGAYGGEIRKHFFLDIVEP